MIGVDILSVYDVAIEHTHNWTAFWIATFIVFLIFFIGGICDIDVYDCKCLVPWIITGAIIAPMVGIIIGGIFKTPIKYTNEYKVTISDEVSMNEFAAKYEIVDQEGKIYIVRERE